MFEAPFKSILAVKTSGTWLFILIHWFNLRNSFRKTRFELTLHLSKTDRFFQNYFPQGLEPQQDSRQLPGLIDGPGSYKKPCMPTVYKTGNMHA